MAAKQSMVALRQSGAESDERDIQMTFECYADASGMQSGELVCSSSPSATAGPASSSPAAGPHSGSAVDRKAGSRSTVPIARLFAKPKDCINIWTVC